jgi:hypothetical protein
MRFIVLGLLRAWAHSKERPFRQRQVLYRVASLRMRAKAMMNVLINKRLRVFY